MNETLRDTIDLLRIEAAATHENLTIFPLVGGRPGPRRYRTFDEAQRAGTARITEVGAAGHVPELLLYNDGDLPLLLLDGEELKGAKQNRVLNLTILAPARDKLVIPVTCVEQGRWHAMSAAFAPTERVMYARARAAKMGQVSASLAFNRGFRSDQAAMWRDIDLKSSTLGSTSGTGAMEGVFEERGHDVDEYVRAIRPVPGQTGAIFALDGRAVGCELFDHPEVLELYFPKLVRSYALDAIETRGRNKEVPPPEAARAFLDEVAGATTREFHGVGSGNTLRLSSPRLTGAALVEGGAVVHLSAFRSDDDGGGAGGGGGRGLARFSLRRR